MMVILGTSLAGATYLTMTVTNSVRMNRNRITATYFAQECMELVRNLRDSSWKQNLPWDCAFRGIDGRLDDQKVFRIAADPDRIPSGMGNPQTYCRENLGMYLEENPGSFSLQKNGSVFSHEAGEPTIFDRKVKISAVSPVGGASAVSAKFTCEVSWKDGDQQESLSLSQVLTNWKR